MAEDHRLEGFIIAQRAVIARLVAAHPDREALLAELADRSVVRDGQEDPGAVPSEGFDIAGATAQEFQLIADEVRRLAAGEQS